MSGLKEVEIICSSCKFYKESDCLKRECPKAYLKEDVLAWVEEKKKELIKHICKLEKFQTKKIKNEILLVSYSEVTKLTDIFSDLENVDAKQEAKG